MIGLTVPVMVLGEAVYVVLPTGSGSAVLMYKSIRYNNDIIQKPSCETPAKAKIFVAPVRMLGGRASPLTPIAGISTFAVDNGDGTWTVKGQVKTAGDATVEDPQGISMIVETYCCTNDLCN